MKTVMKTAAISLALFSAVCSASAQEKKEAPGAPAAPAKPAPTADELEAKFKATLADATMSGRWCMLKDGKMGPDKEDKYTIVSVEKKGDGQWTINARIQYGNFDMVAPVPVIMKWAGDTPVMIVDNVGFPGTAKYSARVMFFGDTYSGTWSGGDHGGLMHGVITRGKPPEKPAETK